jgi:hypothetical protein
MIMFIELHWTLTLPAMKLFPFATQLAIASIRVGIMIWISSMLSLEIPLAYPFLVRQFITIAVSWTIIIQGFFVSFLSVALACPRSGLDGACLESTSPKLYLDPVYYSRRPFDPLIEEILADLFPDA